MPEYAALKEAIHSISTFLEMPAIIVLIVIVAVTVIELGSLFAELFAERRRARVDVKGIVLQIRGRTREEILDVILCSGFAARKKAAFEELLSDELTPEALEALAVRVVSREELRSQRIVQVTDIIARIGPMFGLMATLIPLGPGLIALGQGDTETLSSSLLTAFDATVSGLAAAGVAYIISRVRKRWYASDLLNMEAVTDAVLGELAEGRSGDGGRREGKPGDGGRCDGKPGDGRQTDREGRAG
jgi:biopolymer transport protein ExbB/TolQ